MYIFYINSYKFVVLLLLIIVNYVQYFSTKPNNEIWIFSNNCHIIFNWSLSNKCNVLNPNDI